MNNKVEKAKAQGNVRTLGHYIDGKVVQSVTGNIIHRHNPANGALVATWPAGTAADVDLAVAAAVKAFDDGRWSELTAGARSEVLRKAAALIRSNAEHLAMIECLETGKPLVQAHDEMLWASDIWDYAAGQARSLHGEVHSNLGEGKLALVLREPIGPVGLITPWNYPLIVLSQKLPFALAAGCTAVIKPSEFTAGTTLEMMRLLEESGLPAGVVNVVNGYGDPVGKHLAEHNDIRLISFTGSTATGRSILVAAALNMKKVVLELGGKNPSIVFADADIDNAVDGAIKGFVYNAGAECCSGSRVLVQRSIAKDFKAKLIDKLKTIKMGDPMDPETNLGSIVNEPQFKKIQQYLDEGKKVATVAIGGNTREDLGGFFVEPTVFVDVPMSASIVREEIFGPVVAVLEFDDFDEAILISNDTDYGLAASVWTTDFDTALAAARKLRSGIVWVNTFMDGPSEVPLGGTRQSGYGRENGLHAIGEFTVLKTVVSQSAGGYARYIS
ncbi:aldehyde dehydrogenase family protein [Pararhizobium sp.]|uniref:aldehyde dehydrogenase family protein n=1 Tax=Pararhizobium sp. TaxID=1977563 RepID=UPI002716A623|nr:aldehyde dehydrogenase family protein [Pararhizobium sp.]MDO9415550.1 aldehyde dehydrogenase family protein [Pararhizobium sp.]